uniref:Uncharacterized protein n=1 Tax=Kalanchoe fedtschenkoi TaxID=63787 RepID=A0A7N0V0I7_KALFE
MRIFLLVSPSPSRLAVQSRRCCCCWTMNRTALKSALLGSNSGAVHFSAALFHSTPYLHRKSSRWDSSWQSDFDEDESPSWFRKQYGHKGSRKGRIKNQKPGFSGRRGFQFCNDDVDVESLFRAAFGEIHGGGELGGKMITPLAVEHPGIVDMRTRMIHQLSWTE